MPVLEVKGLTKKFGGLVAVNEASFTIEENKISCLIGPNGSGKTTIFNLITGSLPADSGSVLYKEQELIGKKVSQTVELGIARTFQDLKLFSEFTVLQNVMVAMRGRHGEKVLQGLFYSEKSAAAQKDLEKAHEILRLFDLNDEADTLVSGLPYGMQKLVSLARLYAVDANLLLLDEPASGMDKEGYAIMDQAMNIFIESGKTILLVEHNMDFVKNIAEKVIFLHQGKVLAQGSMEEITSDKHLTEIYFGY
ncbi:MAG: ABC transporter ATP-binding protein [Anaerovoracaceae bacterium]